MPASRRGRACDACHAIKIKCELGAAGGGDPPCHRCIRLKKTCAVSAPTSKKDRIAELEAKIEEMTKLMRMHEINGAWLDASNSAPITPESVDSGRIELRAKEGLSKKRRLDSASTVEGAAIPLSEYSGQLEIDQVVSRKTQMQLLDKYRDEIEPVFPFRITGGYEDLRNEHPILLQAIVFATSPGVLSIENQEKLTMIIAKLLDPEQILKTSKSIELVQATLICSFWYRAPTNQLRNGVDGFFNLALSIAKEIGLSNSESVLNAASLDSGNQISSFKALRTWNLCFILSASLGTCFRTPPKIPWGTDIETWLSFMQYSRDSLSTDGLLCQFVRAERLCQQITTEAGYLDSVSTLEVTNHVEMRRLRNLITDTKVQALSSLSCQGLKMYEHFSTILLHECVLHTSTNNRSFAGPYVAERLSMTDFPAPVVTAGHVASLYELRDVCHTVLNIYMALEISTIASSPFIVFTAKAFYAIWILTKLYVAVTATGNTFGAFIDEQTLELDLYLEKLADLGDALYAIDELSSPGRGLRSSKRLREWIWNYNSLRAEESLSSFPLPAATDLVSESVRMRYPDSTDWTAIDPHRDVPDCELEDLFSTFLA